MSAITTEVPVGWDRKRIGDCASVKRGASPRPIEDAKWWGGEIGWVRISDVTSARKYLFKTRDYLSEAGVRQSVEIKVGEVVMSICATIGRSIITTTPICIHDGFVWFDGLGDHIDREYFYYYLASKEAEFSGHRQMGTQGNLNTTIVSNVDLLIPESKPEQTKIAEILSTVDRAIEQTEALIAKQQRLKTGLMQDLLTRGIDEHGNLRSEQTHKFKDSPLGRIPVEWEISSVGDQFSITSGFCLGPHRLAKDNPRPYLRVANVQRGFVSLEDVTEMEATDREMETRSLLQDDLLIVEGHADISQIGRCARVPQEAVGFTFQNHLFRLRPRSVSSRFADIWLNSPIVQKYWRVQCGTSSGLNTINRFMLSRVPILLMDEEEQQRVVAAFVGSDDSADITRYNLSKLRSLKTALMQDLLTGRKRVTELLNDKEASA